MRREFPAKVKLAAWERARGHCESCTAKLFPGNTEYDHINADQLGGDSTFDNCQALCKSCHAGKTRKDRKAIAKSNHVRRAHRGIRQVRRSFATNKDGPFKRRMDGTVVRR